MSKNPQGDSSSTPGPWQFVDRPNFADRMPRVCSVKPGGKELLAIATIDFTGNSETEANAHLISAAPDLLAVLEAWIAHRSAVFDAQMRKGINSIPSARIDAIVADAHAAIAKARGQS